jgi:SSS family solute:Na+ symporter
LSLGSLDIVIFGSYFLVLFWIARRRKVQSGEEEYLFSGRSLTLPALVATLVSTWYGGILGVGEFNYKYGISQWLIFGFPYYVMALIYAFYWIKRFRISEAITLPELAKRTFGISTGKITALFIFLLVSPAPYLFMLGVFLSEWVFDGVSVLICSALAGVFSYLYVQRDGFRAVVSTDKLQFVLMMLGFGLLVGFSFAEFGNLGSQLIQLPATHVSLTGNFSWLYIFSWFFLAMWTFVDPGFHQRVIAAKDEKTAKNGVLISIGFWMIFDALMVIAGLYGVANLPVLENPAMVYPALAEMVLPTGAKGLFLVGVLSAIMSTLDSMMLLSGQTLAHDLGIGKYGTQQNARLGMVFAVVLSLVLIAFFPGVVDLWYAIGSLAIPALLLMLWLSTRNNIWMTGTSLGFIMLTMFFSTAGWMLLGLFQSQHQSVEFGGIPPFYAGMLVGLVLTGVDYLVKNVLDT